MAQRHKHVTVNMIGSEFDSHSGKLNVYFFLWYIYRYSVKLIYFLLFCFIIIYTFIPRMECLNSRFPLLILHCKMERACVIKYSLHNLKKSISYLFNNTLFNTIVLVKIFHVNLVKCIQLAKRTKN